MPRFFLDQVHQGDCIRGAEGAEFADLDALKEEAVAAAREIMAERLIRGDALNHSQCEIRNAEGRKDALPDNKAKREPFSRRFRWRRGT